MIGKCTICGKTAVVERKHEGRNLCRKHFIESFEGKFRKVAGKNRMVESGDHIGAALSGGRDSSVILALMKNLVGKRRDVTLAGITVDEGTTDSRAAVASASSLCKKMGIVHHVFSFKNELGSTLKKPAKGGQGPATLEGTGLRWILNKESKSLGFTKLCIGTSLDDEAESIMMNYLRGDVLRAAGLGFVSDAAKDFVPRIKPLRLSEKSEIELYAKIKGIKYYSAPKLPGLRLDVEAMVAGFEKRYPGTKYNIVETFDKILPKIKSASAGSKKKVTKCAKCGEPCSNKICKKCELWC
jgi:uncharacterized protein (TIGR00269 family)